MRDGIRHRKIGISTGIVLVACLIIPAAADQLVPTITRVYFEKDGVPYDGSVQFTVNCYGYRCSGYDCSAGGTAGIITASVPESVYSFSATCPEYGCIIYEPFYLNYRHIDRCDLEGVSHNASFVIANFSTTPVPACTDLRQFSMGGKGGVRGYYNGTPEYEQCLDTVRTGRESCNRFLVECDPAEDTDCGYWIVDGRRVKESPAYNDCREEMNRKQYACDVYLEEVDPATMTLWTDRDTGRQEPAMRECELRFSIPSGNTTPDVTSGSRQQHYVPKNPVESLYCSILQFFGGSC